MEKLSQVAIRALPCGNVGDRGRLREKGRVRKNRNSGMRGITRLTRFSPCKCRKERSCGCSAPFWHARKSEGPGLGSRGLRLLQPSDSERLEGELRGNLQATRSAAAQERVTNAHVTGRSQPKSTSGGA